jgi:hypothetical protein
MGLCALIRTEPIYMESEHYWTYYVDLTGLDGDPDLEELGASVPHCDHISRWQVKVFLNSRKIYLNASPEPVQVRRGGIWDAPGGPRNPVVAGNSHFGVVSWSRRSYQTKLGSKRTRRMVRLLSPGRKRKGIGTWFIFIDLNPLPSRRLTFQGRSALDSAVNRNRKCLFQVVN